MIDILLIVPSAILAYLMIKYILRGETSEDIMRREIGDEAADRIIKHNKGQR